MNRNIIAGLAIIIALAGACFFVLSDGSPETYSITYEADGADTQGLPISYTEGQSVELSDPVREGYVFRGWYTDPEFTERIHSISSDMKCDITLYAKWSPIGDGETYTIAYVTYGADNPNNPSSYVSGTGCTLSPLEEEGAIFLGWYTDESCAEEYRITEIDITVRGDITLYSHWRLALEGKGFVLSLEGSIAGSTWYSTKYYLMGEVTYRYLFDRDGTYLMSCEQNIGYYQKVGLSRYFLVDQRTSSSTYWTDENDSEFTYLGEETISTVNGDVECDVYLSEDRSEKQWIGDGWIPYRIAYVNGNTSLTYTFKETVEFEPIKECNVTVGSDDGLTVKGAGTYEIGSRVELTVEVSKGAYFMGWYDDDDNLISSDRTYVIDRITSDISIHAKNGSGIERSFAWKYANKEYTYTLSIDYADYMTYVNSDIPRQFSTYNAQKYAHNFVTYQDKYILRIASDFKDLAISKGWTDAQVAAFVLTFVQYIKYTSDADSKGMEEYWKYPLETLFDRCGDCEDTSILYASIMKAMGYDVALVLLPEHMAAAVNMDGLSGSYFTSGAKKYYYAETTASGYSVGTNPNPNLYTQNNATIILL